MMRRGGCCKRLRPSRNMARQREANRRLEVVRQVVGRGVAPGGDEGGREGGFGCGFEDDFGAAAAAPGTVYGLEYFGMSADECFLLLRIELDHAPGLARAERG